MVTAGRTKEPRETYLYNGCPGSQTGRGKSGLMWGKHVRNGVCGQGTQSIPKFRKEELYHHWNEVSKRSICAQAILVVIPI